MRFAVTGASGYLGGHVVRELVSRGHSVEQIKTHCNPDILTGIDGVAHLGWFSKAGPGYAESQRMALVNTIHFLDKLEANCPQARIVFPSSAAVYGCCNKLITEDDPCFPECGYSRGKVAAEMCIRELFVGETCIFRFGSLMGKGVTRTKLDLCVNAFASDSYARKKIEVWNPWCFKPILHVRDAAWLIAEALTSGVSGTFNAQVQSIAAWDLAKAVADKTGAEIEMVEDASGVRSCRMDCSRLHAAFPELKFRTLDEAILEFAT